MEPDFSGKDFEILGVEQRYEGFHEIRRFRLRHRLHQGGWSDEMLREVSVRGSAAACAVYDPDRDLVCMVEQFRVATSLEGDLPWSLEIVAGLIDKEGESAEQVIRRELAEEAGISPRVILPVTRYWVSPGGSAARMHLFVALCNLSEVKEEVFGLDDENEDILVRVLPLKNVHEYAISHENSNAASLIGLQWLLLNRQTLYDNWQKLKKA